MDSGACRWGVALAAAAVINGGVFLSTLLLAHERRPPQDTTAPVAVQLVSISPPTPPASEATPEPAPPKEAPPRPDFMPDIAPPGLAGAGRVDLVVQVSPSFGAPSGLYGDLSFEESDLDRPPRPVANSAPAYPYLARQRGIEGHVTVRMLVERDGSVGALEIVDARPQEVFEDAVRRTVADWSFEPGQIAGEPVSAWVEMTIRFDLNQ